MERGLRENSLMSTRTCTCFRYRGHEEYLLASTGEHTTERGDDQVDKFAHEKYTRRPFRVQSVFSTESSRNTA